MSFTVRCIATGEVAIVDTMAGHDDPTVWEVVDVPPPPANDPGPFVLSQSGTAFVAASPTETPVTLIQLYTPTEFAALWNAACTNGQIAGLLAAAIATPQIDFASPAFAAGLQLAQAAGILTADRAARIAAGLPPVAG